MTAQGGALRSAWLRAPPQNRRAIFPMCYGPEMIAKALRKWVAKAGCQIHDIAPGSPWENGDSRARQRPAQGRVPETGDLLFAKGGAGRNRSLAKHLQPRPAALVPGLPTARACQLPRSGLPATHGSGHAVAFQSARSKRPVKSAACRGRFGRQSRPERVPPRACFGSSPNPVVGRRHSQPFPQPVAFIGAGKGSGTPQDDNASEIIVFELRSLPVPAV